MHKYISHYWVYMNIYSTLKLAKTKLDQRGFTYRNIQLKANLYFKKNKEDSWRNCFSLRKETWKLGGFSTLFDSFPFLFKTLSYKIILMTHLKE